MNARSDDLSRRLSAALDRISELEQELEGDNSEVQTNTANIDRLEDDIEENDAEIDELEEKTRLNMMLIMANQQNITANTMNIRNVCNQVM